MKSSNCRVLTVAILVVGLWISDDATGGESGLRFVTPTDEQIVRPGEVLAVVVEVDPSVDVSHIELLGDFSSGIEERTIDGPPFETTITVPLDLSGRVKLLAWTDAVGGADRYRSAKIHLNVVPSDSPDSLAVIPASMRLDLSQGNARPRRIRVVGSYSDGTERVLHRPGLGTTYESNDPNIATVDNDGYVRAEGPGLTYVTVRNGSGRAWVAVKVMDRSQALPPAIEHSAALTINRGGFRLDTESGLFVQTMTLINRSDAPLVLPLVIVLDGLTDAVELASRSGYTNHISPKGRPWQRIERGGEVLGPGEMLTLHLRFRNVAGVPINYTPRIYGALAP